jgi:hypothetical protein
MDLNRMRQLDDRYGPIDWRVPEAHSLYWSDAGLPLAGTSFQTNALRRMRLTSLRALMWKGRLLGNPAEEAGVPLPRPELIAIVKEETARELADTPDPVYQRSFAAFLADAAVLREELGQLELSGELYQELASVSGEVPAGEDAFTGWLGRLMQQDPAEMRPDHAMLRVVATLLQARVYDEFDPARAAGLRGVARQIHRLYQESRDTPEFLARTGLPSFNRIRELLESSGK